MNQKEDNIEKSSGLQSFSERVDSLLDSMYGDNVSLKKDLKESLLDRLESIDMVNFDFENKQVLDLASSWPILPRFLQSVYETSNIKCIDLNVEQDFIDMMGDNYIQGDVTKLPFSDESFDLIISTLGVPHVFFVEYENENTTKKITDKDIEDAYKALFESYRCLKIGGSMHLAVSPGENIEEVKNIIDRLEKDLNIQVTLKPLLRGQYVIVIKKKI